METASQILSNTGNANLAYGTGGGLGTAAPVGVFDIGKDNGFDTLAKYQMLKKKDEYDAEKKYYDDLYNAALKIDLSTNELLDIDRKELQDKYIPKVTELLLKYPHALKPRTPEEMKQNLEVQKAIDEFKDFKAKSQTRYVIKPKVDKDIAENVDDRESMNSWYAPQFEKAGGYITPYKKLYKYDKELSKGGDETTEVEVYDPNGTTKTNRAITTNLATTYNKANSLLDGTDKNLNKYVNDTYKAYLNANALVLEEKANLVQQGKPEEAEKIQPYLTREINAANNYITDYNTLHPKTPIPLFSTDKPLDPRGLFLLENIISNVKQTKISENKDVSEFYTQSQREELARLKSALSSKSTKAGAQDYIVNAVTTFVPQPSAEQEMYDNPDSTYINETQAKGQKVKFDKTEYPNVEVHKKGERVFAKIGDKLIEYNGSEWVEANKNKPLSIDDRILKGYAPAGGTFKEAKLEGNKLKLIYSTKGEGNKEGTDIPVYVNRMDYLKGIADTAGGFNATMDLLEQNQITDLNDDIQFQKAIDLVLAKSSKVAQPQGAKPTKKKLPGT